MNIKKMNNKGFSLVEMIVSILIVAIMMLGITCFLTTSRVTYQKVSTSSKLQEEANVTMNFLDEILVEAQDYGWADMNIYSKNYTVLCVKTLDNEPAIDTDGTRTNFLKKCFYFVLIDKADGKIYYTKVSADVSATNTITFTDDKSAGSPTFNIRKLSGVNTDLFQSTIKEDDDRKYYFIADSLDVSDPVDISQSIEKNGRRIKILFKFKYNGEDFVATVNNFLRNKLKF